MVLIIQLIHLAVCIGLIVIVLFQADKSEGLAGAFGGGASNTIFGERGSGGFVSNLTTALAVIFMITSIYLSVYAPKVSSSSSRPVINYNIPAQPTEIPVTPTEENTMAPTAVAPVAPNEVAPAPAPTSVPVTTPAIAPTETTAPAETAVPTPAPAPAETTPAVGQ